TAALGLAAGLRAQAAPGPSAVDLLVDGECGPVLGAGVADLLVLPVSLGQPGQEQRWVAVDAADVQVNQVESMDLTRPIGRVTAQRLHVPAERVLAGLPGWQVPALAAIVLGAEACGIADWAVSTAAEYAKVRYQFGRPIGQFQGVKHRCAWMLTRVEQAAAAVWDAARAARDVDNGRDLAVAAAAALAFDAALRCAKDCIQTLGGIGFTWEHDAHIYLRR